MKNRNVVLFVLLGCFLLVGNAFANFPNCPPPQVGMLHTFDGTHPTATGRVQHTQSNFCRVDQLGTPNRCGSVFMAYLQQEVDPTWFDPWTPSPAVAAAPHPQVAIHKDRRKTVVERKTPVRHSVKAVQEKEVSVQAAERSHKVRTQQ